MSGLIFVIIAYLSIGVCNTITQSEYVSVVDSKVEFAALTLLWPFVILFVGVIILLIPVNKGGK